MAVGGMVAAAQSDNQRISGLDVATAMNEHRCQALTVNVNAANAVYMRSERDRSSTLVPIARISSAASSADTAWTSIPGSLSRMLGCRETWNISRRTSSSAS